MSPHNPTLLSALHKGPPIQWLYVCHTTTIVNGKSQTIVVWTSGVSNIALNRGHPIYLSFYNVRYVTFVLRWFGVVKLKLNL